MDILTDILQTVHVKGSLYFRTAFTSPWGVAVPEYGNVSRFHLVTRGTCLVEIEGVNETLQLEKGDLVVITNGAQHNLFCKTSEKPFLSVDEVVAKSGFKGIGALVWGGEEGNETTSLVCGHFSFDSDRAKTFLESLPPYIHVPNTEIMHYSWLESAMKFITFESTERELGSDAIINRLAEIIFIQTIRTYAKSFKGSKGLFLGLQDPKIRQVLQAIHQKPAENWTIALLAKVAGMSRTSLAERMQQVMGISPIAYLIQWRMTLAHQALKHSRDGVAEISESVGYQSLSAFTRTFKKHFGNGPGEVRKQLKNAN